MRLLPNRLSIVLVPIALGVSLLLREYYLQATISLASWTSLLAILAPFAFILFRWGIHYEKLKIHSEKDALTDVYNRRFVQHVFPKISDMVKRKSEKLTVFVIDIDDFKCVNDSYGHDTGDLVIKQLASSLLLNTRASDIVSRWGGDEFVVIAPFSGGEPSYILQERLERDITITAAKKTFTVSVSIGKAIFPDQGDHLDELLQAADQSMYDLKYYKKNQHKLLESRQIPQDSKRRSIQ